MKYPVVIHKDSDSDYSVTLPDLPGCFTAGDTFENALDMATEAAELHLEGYLEEGIDLPAAMDVGEHMNDVQYAGGVWALIDVDLSKLSGKAKRVNITIPERILASIDEYVAATGGNRSGMLANAAVSYMSEHKGGG